MSRNFKISFSRHHDDDYLFFEDIRRVIATFGANLNYAAFHYPFGKDYFELEGLLLK